MPPYTRTMMGTSLYIIEKQSLDFASAEKPVMRQEGHFDTSSGPASGLGPGGAGAKLGRGAGASSSIDGVFPPRVPAAPPPRPACPPPRPCDVAEEAPCLSCSACCRGLLGRGRRVVLPPRDPGPRSGRPVSWEMGTAAAIGT